MSGFPTLRLPFVLEHGRAALDPAQTVAVPHELGRDPEFRLDAERRFKLQRIVARPESQRRALRLALRFIGLGLVSAIASCPLAFTSTILMNPLLGRLEAKYGVELTGHSGPADWIFGLMFGVTTVALFTVLVVATRTRSTRSVKRASPESAEAGDVTP